MPTKIEYCDETWSPVTGCDPDDGGQSEGCAHCWARRMSKRLAGRFGYPADDPFKVTLHPDRLEQPLRWRKPRRVFVCSMGDLFHEDVPDEWIDQAMSIIAYCDVHTFMVLTKRPQRVLEYFSTSPNPAELPNRKEAIRETMWSDILGGDDWYGRPRIKWPLPNLWLGVTAENQRRADERIPVLLQIPAAVRFVSVEPMLGAVDLPAEWSYVDPDGFGKNGPMTASLCISHIDPDASIDWVICGAETGPGARPMNLDWARSLRDQCQAASVPFFFKRGSDGERTLDGVMWEQYPEQTP